MNKYYNITVMILSLSIFIGLLSQLPFSSQKIDGFVLMDEEITEMDYFHRETGLIAHVEYRIKHTQEMLTLDDAITIALRGEKIRNISWTLIGLTIFDYENATIPIWYFLIHHKPYERNKGTAIIYFIDTSSGEILEIKQGGYTIN